MAWLMVSCKRYFDGRDALLTSLDRFERVDPPRKTPAKAGEEIKAQYAVSNALGRKLITCRLVTVTRAGTQSKKVMCRVGGGAFTCFGMRALLTS